MSKQKLPDTIFVTLDGFDEEDNFLSASKTLEEAVEYGDRESDTQIGEYKLVRTLKAKLRAEIISQE